MTNIFAHRGASHKNRENTVEAFLEAAKLGAEWVEFDLRRSLDGTLVVHHDAQLEDGRLLAEVSSSDLPDYVPSLAEALQACQGMGANIEVKNSPSDPSYNPSYEIAFSVTSIATAYLEYEMILVSSFNFDVIDSIKEVDSRIATGLLFFDPVTAMQNIERAKAGGHDAIHPHISSVDEVFVRQAHKAGLLVNVWIVNEKEHIKEMADLGVNGIITDVPDMAAKILAKDFGRQKFQT